MTTTRMLRFVWCLFLLLASSQWALAQDEPREPAGNDVAEAVIAPSDDPIDRIVQHFLAMSNILTENMDAPDALLTKFDAYIKANDKAMRAASKAFETRLGRMKVDEAELYRETAQRKLTPVLDRFIGQLMQLEARHPTAAKNLDSLLKIDARYSWQQ
ncbi:MAG: hypothetical protein FWC40_03295 [Proteobacteria bacterium]|nr:hypothetical protein [Pseudomonadota bacterium]